MKKEFSEKFRYVGFIMTCAMVLYHCPHIDNYYALSPLDAFVNSLFDSGIKTLGVLIMSWFFSATGFLLFRGYSMENYPEKIKRRVFSLLLPYLAWQLIIVLIDALQGQYDFVLTDFLTKTFLLEIWPIDGPLWYVYAVFLLAVLSPPLFFLLKRKKLFAWAAILALILLTEACKNINAPAVRNIVEYGYIGNILTYIPAYLVGAFFGYYHNEDSSPDLYLVLSLLLMALLLNSVSDGFFYYASLQMLPIAALYLLPSFPVLHGRKIYRLSFLIYAMHLPLITDLWSPVLGFYMNTVGRLTMAASIGSITTNLMLLAADITLAALVYAVLSRIMPRLLALLTGGRA